jgi:hypothetical protein
MRNVRAGLVGVLLAVGCGSSGSSTAPSADNIGGGSAGGGGRSSSTTSSGSSDTTPVSDPSDGTGAASGSSGGTSSSGDTAEGDASVPEDASAPSEADLLTAGMWDDSLNYDFFSGYLTKRTTIDGNPCFAMADYDASHAEFATRTTHTLIDAVLVLDTTGSMGDELSYLTAEFASITSAVSANFPNAQQRWALVVYRDTPDTDPGDDYVVKSYDFTSNMHDFGSIVGEQTAANGGDTPESPELGLEQMKQLTWRTDPQVAKLAFWVADAPHHVSKAAAMKQSIVDTHTAGIHVYPVSGSGTDDLLELTMRSTAEITGGRYIFLTDDSGIGGAHKVPEIPCFFVTKLAKDLVRAISMEMTGTYIGPDTSDIIRTVGSPSAAGQCPVQGAEAGTTVTIF